MKKLLFVVTEIAPLDKGGIGTFSRNMVRRFSGEFSMAFLYCGNILPEAIKREYPDIKFYFLPCGLRELSGKTAAQISELLAETLDFIFQTDVFDYVEFMDWGGWAHQSIMLKRSGKSNISHSTVIAVRIHSTEHALRKYEHRLLSLHDGVASDFELTSVLLADLVICHVAPIAKLVVDEIKSLFGKDITHKIAVTPMPVYINGDEEEHSTIATESTEIVFSSKTQQIKRPDVFVHGVSAFLEKNKNHEGDVVFAAHINEDTYTRSVFSLIPKRLMHRFVYDRFFKKEERDGAIANGITVFPAEYESFCFAAYEASLLGSIVVLNETNPAFSEATPWVDGVNCIKFDGTADGLCLALERVISLKQPLQSIRGRLPEAQIIIPDLSGPRRQAPPLIDIVIYAKDLKDMGDTMSSIKLNSFGNETDVHLFLADEAAQSLETDSVTRDKIAGRFSVVPSATNPVELLGACAQKSKSDYILFIASGNQLAPDLLATFKKSFEHYDADVFSTWTRNLHHGGHLNRYYGAMPLNAWRYNMIASPLAFYKTSLLKKYFKKAGGRLFNFYAMHMYLSMTGADYVISSRNECITDNPYHEYCIHDSGAIERAAFFRAILFEMLQVPPPTLAILMAKPELMQLTASGPGKGLPSFDTYIYRKYIKKVKILDNILRYLKIVT